MTLSILGIFHPDFSDDVHALNMFITCDRHVDHLHHQHDDEHVDQHVGQYLDQYEGFYFVIM